MAIGPRQRLVLLIMAAMVVVGCALPSFFHDTYANRGDVFHRNRLTGDVTVEYGMRSSWGFRAPGGCFGP